jgi:hypothetical protein
MSKGQVTNVQAAFEMLTREIEAETDLTRRTGAGAFAEGRLDTVRLAADRAEWLAGFLAKVASLEEEWRNSDSSAIADMPSNACEHGIAKPPVGNRTPIYAFYLPVLRALDHLGGSARVDQALAEVGRLMAEHLTARDRMALPSAPGSHRWCNTAQWARFHLSQWGYLEPHSPRGVWTISSTGRECLASGARPSGPAVRKS